MIPSRRTYGLLLLGGAVIFLFNPAGSLAALLLFDLIVLGLTIWDSSRVKLHRVNVDRQVASRLSIGRDNLVSLTVESGARSAEVRIYDKYPIAFLVSSMPLAMKL
ncbi:MAG: DUF58 domain-containing protein, partial [Leptolyngbya sp. ERB_1_2]